MARKSLASRLDQKVEILAVTIVPDEGGGWEEVESVYAITWAQIEASSARNVERLVGSSIQASLTDLVTIRPMAGLKHTMRIRWTPRRSDGDQTTRTAHIRGIQDMGDRYVIAVERQAE